VVSPPARGISERHHSKRRDRKAPRRRIRRPSGHLVARAAGHQRDRETLYANGAHLSLAGSALVAELLRPVFADDGLLGQIEKNTE
jgi:hypothetical protein